MQTMTKRIFLWVTAIVVLLLVPMIAMQFNTGVNWGPLDFAVAAALLGQLVGSLTPHQRSAFVLREVEGMDTAEVAEILGCSATTVRNHVFQARKILRQELARKYPEYLPKSHRG